MGISNLADFDSPLGFLGGTGGAVLLTTVPTTLALPLTIAEWKNIPWESVFFAKMLMVKLTKIRIVSFYMERVRTHVSISFSVVKA